jgi:pSer/pThr/pTyr-binding forkhead associated (FHA) protein
MSVYIEVIEGENKGLRFKAKEGLRIGRTLGEITINDGKISSLHAQIEKDPSGRLLIKDLDSSNGIFVDASRVKTVLLVNGAIFLMGKTKFKVLLSEPKKLLPKEPLATESELPSWKNLFGHFLDSRFHLIYI